MFAGVLREHLDFNLSSNLVNSAIGNSFFVNEANRSRSTIVSRLSTVELPLIVFQKHDCFTTHEEKRVPKKTNKIHYLAGISFLLKTVANLWLRVTKCSESEINS